MNSLMRLIAYAFLALPGLVVIPAMQSVIRGSAGFILAILIYAIVLFLVALVHEAGHAIAARAVGWRVTLFAVFPFAYHPQKKMWKLWASSSGDLGGAVGFSRNGRNTNARALLVALSGPLANFLMALVGVCIAYLVPHLQNGMGYIGGTSLFVGIGNLLPWRTRNGAKSDGARVIFLVRRMVGV